MRKLSQLRAAPLSVRSRVLAAVLALTTLGMLVAGGTAHLLQRNAVDARIDDSLQRSVGEFRTLAETGIDPSTRRSFTAADDLVYLAMQRTLPAPHEGMLGLSGGDITWRAHSGVQLRLEDDPELVSWLRNYDAGNQVRLSSVQTAVTQYRLVAVPVQLSSDPAPSLFVLAYDRSAELDRVNDAFRTYAGVGLGALVLIGVVGWLIAGRLLQPIRLLRETAQDIGESDLSRRIPVTGNDDLSELTRTFNAMLDRLQNSFNSQRRLMDDVGHELRTPITIVRGHLELVDPQDPADVASVRSIGLEELDRMHLLVDDLVTLAHAERPDFVQARLLDVGQLTDDVLDKARQLGQRQWRIDARANGRCSLDPRRITQAWLQLAANAVKFSQPGTTIALGSTLGGGRARLWVRDEGIGVAPEDQERIFERFNRGGGSTRDGGSGLGLAIVRAIAAAHGGTVAVHSIPGHGSTFILDLPAEAAGIGERKEDNESDSDH